MKFEIVRTSHFGFSRKDKPCEGVEPFVRTITSDNGSSWDVYHWTMEFETFQDVIDFMRKQEEDVVIMKRNINIPGLPDYIIEIYDDYRE